MTPINPLSVFETVDLMLMLSVHRHHHRGDDDDDGHHDWIWRSRTCEQSLWSSSPSLTFWSALRCSTHSNHSSNWIKEIASVKRRCIGKLGTTSLRQISTTLPGTLSIRFRTKREFNGSLLDRSTSQLLSSLPSVRELSDLTCNIHLISFIHSFIHIISACNLNWHCQ